MGIIIVGVDPAATHLASLTIGGPEPYEYTYMKAPIGVTERCLSAEAWMMARVERYAGIDRVVVALEAPVLGRGGAGSTIPQATVRGALICGAMRAGAEYVIDVNNQRWKKQIIGRHGLSKPEIAQHVELTWPRLWRDVERNVPKSFRQDIYDASCIALYGGFVAKLRDKVAKKRGVSRAR